MSREKMVSANNCGSDQIPTAQLIVRMLSGGNSYFPLKLRAGRRRTRPSRNQPQIMPHAPRVSRMVPMLTPSSVVRKGASQVAELMPELGATHPTDHDPMERIKD